MSKYLTTPDENPIGWALVLIYALALLALAG